MSWGVKTTCFKAPGVSLGGSGVSIGGVRSLRVRYGKIYKSGHTHLEYENVFSFRWVIDRLKPENQPFFLGISPTGWWPATGSMHYSRVFLLAPGWYSVGFQRCGTCEPGHGLIIRVTKRKGKRFRCFDSSGFAVNPRPFTKEV